MVGLAVPLRWLTLGLRSVFLPGNTWNHPATALVLLAWCPVGLLVSLRTFTWTPERER